MEYSGNTANDLYSGSYIYMMKEGRGRSNSGGNFLMSKTYDNWYFELNTLLENGSTLFRDQQYHGTALENEKCGLFAPGYRVEQRALLHCHRHGKQRGK